MIKPVSIEKEQKSPNVELKIDKKNEKERRDHLANKDHEPRSTDSQEKLTDLSHQTPDSAEQSPDVEWKIDKTKEKRNHIVKEDKKSIDPPQKSTYPYEESPYSADQTPDVEWKIDKTEEKESIPIANTQPPEIILNTYGERVDEYGNRLDAEGNIFQIEEIEEEEEEGGMLMDELKPAQFFKNRSAIVLPPMHGRNFQIEIGTIKMVRDKVYYGMKHEDPFDHIEVFEDSIGNINFDGVSHEWLCCKLFHHTLGDEALRWLKLLEPGSLKTWKEVRSEFLNHFFDEAKSEEMRRKITTFQQVKSETFHETWTRYRWYLRDIPHHGFSDSKVVTMFYEGVHSRHQRALNVASGGNFKGQNHVEALKIIERYAKSSSANEVMTEEEEENPTQAEEIAEIKRMMEEILIKEKKTISSADQVNPMVDKSYASRVCFEEPRRQHNDDTYSKFEEDYTTPTWTQGAKQGTLSRRTDHNPKEGGIVIKTRSGEIRVPNFAIDPETKEIIEIEEKDDCEALDSETTDLEECADRLEAETKKPEKFVLKKEKNTVSERVSNDTTSCVDRHNLQRDAENFCEYSVDRHNSGVDRHNPETVKTSPNLKPKDPEAENGDFSQPEPYESVFIDIPPYPRVVKASYDLSLKIIRPISVTEFQDLPCVKIVVDKVFADAATFQDALEFICMKCTAVIRSRIPEKLEGPRSFVLSCTIGHKRIHYEIEATEIEEKKMFDPGEEEKVQPKFTAISKDPVYALKHRAPYITQHLPQPMQAIRCFSIGVNAAIEVPPIPTAHPGASCAFLGRSFVTKTHKPPWKRQIDHIDYTEEVKNKSVSDDEELRQEREAVEKLERPLYGKDLVELEEITEQSTNTFRDDRLMIPDDRLDPFVCQPTKSFPLQPPTLIHVPFDHDFKNPAECKREAVVVFDPGDIILPHEPMEVVEEKEIHLYTKECYAEEPVILRGIGKPNRKDESPALSSEPLDRYSATVISEIDNLQPNLLCKSPIFVIEAATLVSFDKKKALNKHYTKRRRAHTKAGAKLAIAANIHDHGDTSLVYSNGPRPP